MDRYRISHNILPESIISEIESLGFCESIGYYSVLNDIANSPIVKFLQMEVYELSSKFLNPVLAHTVNITEYTKETYNDILWDAHTDENEAEYITLIFLGCGDDDWVGGELDLYLSLNAFDFPNNKVRIPPSRGTVVTFKSNMIHKICPYFGRRSRKTLSVGWE